MSGIWLDFGRAVSSVSAGMLLSRGGFLCCSSHVQMFAPHTCSSECPARPWGSQDLWRTMQGPDKGVQNQQALLTAVIISKHRLQLLVSLQQALPALSGLSKIIMPECPDRSGNLWP